MEVGSSSLPGTTSEIIVNYQFSIINSPSGGLAQLARAPALQAGGQRFESVILHLSSSACSLQPGQIIKFKAQSSKFKAGIDL